MGDLFSVEQSITEQIRQDKPEELKKILEKNNFDKNKLITPEQRTLVQLCCYFGSSKTLEFLINLGYDINMKEKSNNNSPLFIACKFNYLDLVSILLTNEKQECKTLTVNDEGINEFEVAFLRGNYNICYYLLYVYDNDENNINNDNAKDNNADEVFNNIGNNENDDINTNYEGKNEPNINQSQNKNIYLEFFDAPAFILEKYVGIHETFQYPLFNIPLFYASLKAKIIPEKCPSFAAEHKRTIELLTKVPDPNESWGHFVKRLLNFELYNPPMVDKDTVQRTNSLYMRSQMNLISMEYGIKVDYADQGSVNNRYNDEENNLINVSRFQFKSPTEKPKNFGGGINIKSNNSFLPSNSATSKYKLMTSRKNTAKLETDAVLENSDENKFIEKKIGEKKLQLYKSARGESGDYMIGDDNKSGKKRYNEDDNNRNRTMTNNYLKRPGHFDVFK